MKEMIVSYWKIITNIDRGVDGLLMEVYSGPPNTHATSRRRARKVPPQCNDTIKNKKGEEGGERKSNYKFARDKMNNQVARGTPAPALSIVPQEDRCQQQFLHETQ